MSRILVQAACVAAVMTAAVFVLSPLAAHADKEVPIPGLGATCAACHSEPASAWARTLHRRTVGSPQIPADRQGCAACHSGAAAHLEDPTAEGNQPTLSGSDVTGVCLTCHRGGAQALWGLSPHRAGEDGCLACHEPHGGVGMAMLKREEPELCQECHPTQVAEGSLPSHHPIVEGKMVCSDCHNVHGEQRGALSAASTSEMCYRCHAEKAGPFAFEHAPVTEDCATCHKPHGSQNNYLLAQDQPMLCLQCHVGHSDGHRTPLVSSDPSTPEGVAEAEIAIRTFYDRCTSCHSRIHGSDLPSGTNNGTFMPGGPLAASSAGSSGVHALSASAADYSLWGFGGFDLTRFDDDGNHNYVREYDGKDYDVPDASIDVLRFTADSDLRLRMEGLGQGDEDVSLRFGNPIYDVQVRQRNLTHRLGSYRDPAAGAGTVTFPGATAEATDRTGGKDDYRLGRTTLDLRLSARCPKLRQVKWIANAWRETERGSQQFLFLERCGACHKVAVAEPLDRRTTVTQIGLEVDLPSGALRYIREARDFDNRAPEMYNDFPGGGGGRVYIGSAPLFGVATTRSDINDLRGTAQVGSQVSAAALWRTHDRDNRLGGGRLESRSSGGALGWAASRDLDVGVSLVGSSLDVTQTENGISRDRDTARVNLRYTGIESSIIGLGYSRETIKRGSATELHPHGVPQKSISDVWRASVISRLTPQTRLQLRYRATDTDARDFYDPAEPPEHFPSRLVGPPTDGRVWSAVLSHNLSDRTLASAMYSKRESTYEVSVPGENAARSSEDEIRTTGVQVAHTPSQRSRVSASYYVQKMDARSNATYGTEEYILNDVVAFPPIEAFATSDYEAKTGLVDASYWVTSRVRLFGRYGKTTSVGQGTTYGAGDYLDQDVDADGVNLVFHPFDTDIVDRWIGVGYLLNPTTEIALSAQRRSWENDADRTQNGSYDIWRLGVRAAF